MSNVDFIIDAFTYLYSEIIYCTKTNNEQVNGKVRPNFKEWQSSVPVEQSLPIMSPCGCLYQGQIFLKRNRELCFFFLNVYRGNQILWQLIVLCGLQLSNTWDCKNNNTKQTFLFWKFPTLSKILGRVLCKKGHSGVILYIGRQTWCLPGSGLV